MANRAASFNPNPPAQQLARIARGLRWIWIGCPRDAGQSPASSVQAASWTRPTASEGKRDACGQPIRVKDRHPAGPRQAGQGGQDRRAVSWLG